MSQINIEDPRFLLAILNAEVVRRTRVLVTEGVAYDLTWQDSLKKLIQMIDELKRSQEKNTVVTESMHEVSIPNVASQPNRVVNASNSINYAKQLVLDYPVGIRVTIGKGKTAWTVADHSWDEVLLTRTGPGRTARSAKAALIKKIK